MKVIQRILEAQKNQTPLLSCEIVPPPRGKSANDIFEIVEKLYPLKPAWIDVTSHSSMAYYYENEDGSIKRSISKKRPGTLGICGVIQNRFGIDTVAHILCKGFTREETEDALIELHYLGIHNILALRGDGPNYEKPLKKDRTANVYAEDLVRQIIELRQGQYVADVEEPSPLDFCVGVAGYPEKHFEAANLKTDLKFLKEKVDAGADYIVTQMFFDNQKYFDFVSECRAIGINAPIIPGLKVLRTKSQLVSLPKTFHVDLPTKLVDEIEASPKHIAEIGSRWAFEQCQELLKFGVPSLHFYVMNDVTEVVNISKKLGF